MKERVKLHMHMQWYPRVIFIYQSLALYLTLAKGMHLYYNIINAKCLVSKYESLIVHDLILIHIVIRSNPYTAFVSSFDTGYIVMNMENS